MLGPQDLQGCGRSRHPLALAQIPSRSLHSSSRPAPGSCPRKTAVQLPELTRQEAPWDFRARPLRAVGGKSRKTPDPLFLAGRTDWARRPTTPWAQDCARDYLDALPKESLSQESPRGLLPPHPWVTSSSSSSSRFPIPQSPTPSPRDTFEHITRTSQGLLLADLGQESRAVLFPLPLPFLCSSRSRKSWGKERGIQGRSP